MSRPIGPYAPARRAGDWVVTSGQLGVAPGPDGRPEIVSPDTAAQAERALANVEAVLADEGVSLAKVVKATVFLADVEELAALNEVWSRVFGESRPTRSTVGVAGLPMGARVEIEAWAYAPLT